MPYRYQRLQRQFAVAILTLCALFVSPPATAQAATLLERMAGTYQIVPSRTSASFRVDQVGGPGIDGQFNDFSGTITLNGDDITKSVVDVTIRTSDMTTGDPAQDDFIKGRSVFNVARHPEGRFRSTSVQQISDTTARVEGTLTLKGISKPVTFFVSLVRARGQGRGLTAEFAVQGVFQRGLFSMGIGVPLYANVVKLNIRATARRT